MRTALFERTWLAVKLTVRVSREKGEMAPPGAREDGEVGADRLGRGRDGAGAMDRDQGDDPGGERRAVLASVDEAAGREGEEDSSGERVSGEEDVAPAVEVAGDEVRGVAREDDRGAVGADREGSRRGVARRLWRSRRAGEEGRRAGDAVEEEDVVAAVAVALPGDDVGRRGREGDVGAVGAQLAVVEPTPAAGAPAAWLKRVIVPVPRSER